MGESKIENRLKLRVNGRNNCWLNTVTVELWRPFQVHVAKRLTKVQTLCNNSRHHATTCKYATCVQTDATSNIQQCWELLANNVASVCT